MNDRRLEDLVRLARMSFDHSAQRSRAIAARIEDIDLQLGGLAGPQEAGGMPAVHTALWHRWRERRRTELALVRGDLARDYAASLGETRRAFARLTAIRMLAERQDDDLI